MAIKVKGLSWVGVGTDDFAGGAELIGDSGSWNGHEWQYFKTPDGHLFEIKRSPAETI